MPLTIIAHITAKPDQVELVKTQLENLIGTTRSENGCIQYDLHQDNENPNHFMFFENWETRDLWQEHMNNSHIAQYKAATADAVESFQLFEMTMVQSQAR
ncbi:MAG: putative quinol monooxygenase [Planctomycetota bacterium]